MSEKILFVDDDPNLLASVKRMLHKEFDLEVAIGPEKGLEILASNGPFAVVVADMRMPLMNGIQFLMKVKELNGDTIRIMLTGNADLQTAVNAVNEGNIFRFLTKPCPPETLISILTAALEQYHLVTAERELLEKTLMGTIKMLTEILSLVNPVAFGRTARIRRVVRHISVRLQLPNWWQFEVAALLSQLGCITLPTDLLEKVYARAELSSEEQKIFSEYPDVGHKLIANIPRLEHIASMVALQGQPFTTFAVSKDDEEKKIALGAQLLKIALDYDEFMLNGFSHQKAIFSLQSERNLYNPEILEALENYQGGEVGELVRLVKVHELNTHMIADEEIRAKNGLLLVAKGQEITYPVLARLRSFHERFVIVEPIRVIVLRSDDQ